MGQAQPPITAGTHPLSESIAATASSTGTASWTFPAPPAGQTATGTMCCATAPTTAQFVASIGATVLGDWAGDSIAGPWQAINQGQQVLVTATGLTPGQGYLLNWIGSVDDSTGVQPIWPDPNNTSLESLLASPLGLVYGPSTIAGPLPSFTATVPDNARTLILVITASAAFPAIPTNIDIAGVTTGINYYNQAPYLIGAASQSCCVVVPVNGAADEQYEVNVTYSSTPTLNPTYSVYADTDQYEESVFYNGVAQFANQATNTGTLVSGPARILALSISGTAACQIVGPGGVFLYSSSGAPQSVSMPPNVIIPRGESLAVDFAGSGIGTAIFAYP